MNPLPELFSNHPPLSHRRTNPNLKDFLPGLEEPGRRIWRLATEHLPEIASPSNRTSIPFQTNDQCRSIAPSSSPILRYRIHQKNRENTKLHWAVIGDNSPEMTVKEVELVLRSHPNPDVQNADGDTPLHLICNLRFEKPHHPSIVELFFRYKANPNALNPKMETPLHKASYRRKSGPLVEQLLTANADPNAQDYQGRTPLHLLAQHSLKRLWDPLHKEAILILITRGQGINIPDNQGNTPLHLAIHSRRNREEIQFLIDQGADVNAQNELKNTPLHEYIFQTHPDSTEVQAMIKLFIEKGANQTLLNNEGLPPVPQCAYPTPAILAETVGCPGQTPLHIGAKNPKEFQEFKQLLETAIDIAPRDDLGNTPLHYAALSGFHRAAQLLIDRGAPLNSTNYQKETPLSLAIASLLTQFYQPISSLKQLEGIKEIIDVLHSAASSLGTSLRFNPSIPWSHLPQFPLKQVINLLLDHGANPLHQNEERLSLIEQCLRWGITFSEVPTSSDYFQKIKLSLEK